MPYVALVIWGIWFPRQAHVYVLAGIGSVLTVLGFFLSPEGGVFWVVLTNRGLAFFAIWITAVLIANRGKAELALRHNQERFRDFAQSSADRLWETDAEHRLTYLSHHPTISRGLSPEVGLGKRRWELLGAAADDEIWLAHRADLDNHRPFQNFTYTYLDDQGKEAHVRISGLPVFDDGEISPATGER